MCFVSGNVWSEAAVCSWTSRLISGNVLLYMHHFWVRTCDKVPSVVWEKSAFTDDATDRRLRNMSSLGKETLSLFSLFLLFCHDLCTKSGSCWYMFSFELLLIVSVLCSLFLQVAADLQCGTRHCFLSWHQTCPRTSGNPTEAVIIYFLSSKTKQNPEFNSEFH